MRRSVVFTLAVLALAGCGSKTSAPPTTTHTVAVERAACNDLERKIRDVSQLVSGSVDLITTSLHPKQLATRTKDAEKNLLFAASVLASTATPSSLVPARERLVAALRRFAADFGRAVRSVARNDIATAARQLVDRPALASMTAATRAIDRTCGA